MLRENYPQVDPLALDAVFEANNYNYAHTVVALNASLGTQPKPNRAITTSPKHDASLSSVVSEQLFL